MIHIGIENCCKDRPALLQGQRLGLLSNQASTNRHFTHSRDCLLQAFPGQLQALFSPQHGFFSEKQDNMIESDHSVDGVSGLPIYSLYGETRQPTADMFADIDILLVDLIDVGTRVYTFIWTVMYCLETAAQTNTKVLILDRPNPLGGVIMEGNLTHTDCLSFVGRLPIPMRHGLTIGEMALWCNQEAEIGADLEVIPVTGWQRTMLFPATCFPWVSPSPNMPTVDTALVYPGQVLWEGTSISEGRGTTRPFEFFGAPFVEHEAVLAHISDQAVAGGLLRPLVFEPTSGKWAGQACRGFQIHVLDPRIFRPYRLSLELVQALRLFYPDDFQWKEPPYEYAYHRLPMDLIIGNTSIRQSLEQGISIAELEKAWQGELQDYMQRVQKVFLYR